MPAPTADPIGITSRLRAAGCVFAEQEAELLLSVQQSPGQLNVMIGRNFAV